MRKPHSIFLIIFIFLCASCNRTNSERDFLDKIRDIDDLHLLAKSESNDSTLVYIDAARYLIDTDKNLPDTLLIENFFRRGYYYKEIGVPDSAMYYFHKSVDLITGPNDRKRNRVYFRNTWETDEENNNLANGISVAEKLIAISNSEDNSDDLTYAYNFLERIYINLGDFEKSLFYNSKASEAAKKSSNINMYVNTANSKAETLYHHLGKKQEAFELLDSLSGIKFRKDSKRQLYRTYGKLYYHEGNYKETEKYFKDVLRLSKEIELYQNFYLLESYNNLTDLYLETEKYKIAEKYLDSTEAIINSNSFPDYVTKYKEYRFMFNYRTKNKEEEVLKEYRSLIEENNKQHQRKIEEELFALRSANEKEKIAIAAKNESELKNVKLIGLLIFLGLLLLIAYLLYMQRRYRFRKQEIQMQQRLLRAQMNPHFTFNTLSVIHNQIENSKQSAADYLMRFSRLLRLILENSTHNYVRLQNELELLYKYMDLQLLRFPNKFGYNISLENFEEEDLLFIPPMLIQPFVENSIEHGFLGIDYKGQIDISLQLKNKYIYCKIEDNGVGLNKSNIGYKSSVSIRLISKFILKATKQKIRILDKNLDNTSASGVLVKFLIPYKLSEND